MVRLPLSLFALYLISSLTGSCTPLPRHINHGASTAPVIPRPMSTWSSLLSISISVIAPLSVNVVDASSSPSAGPPYIHIMPVIPFPFFVLRVITTWRTIDWPHPAIIAAIVFNSQAEFGIFLPMEHALDATSLALAPQGTDDTMDIDDADPMDTEED